VSIIRFPVAVVNGIHGHVFDTTESSGEFVELLEDPVEELGVADITRCCFVGSTEALALKGQKKV
jgi:hypothetical protein